MVKKDINMAKMIICTEPGIDPFNSENYFHQYSFIYQFTNEDIYLYQSYLKNRESILSVTASGDQVLSSILSGTKNIDCIDISRFPRYYLELKKAAILSLSKEDFLTFFSPEVSQYRLEGIDSTEIYSGFNQNMSKMDKLFWDEILSETSFFDIYDSPLFEPVVNYVQYIPYLEQKNYNDLKQKLKDIEIKYMVGDIFSLAESLNKEYDLVNLSNLIDHSTLNDYQDLIEKIKLTKDGCILSYMFGSETQGRKLNVTWDHHQVKRKSFVTHQRKNY